MAGSPPRRQPATRPIERLEAELTALREENRRLRRRLAAHNDLGAARQPPADRAQHIRTMLRDRASRNP